MEAADGRQVVLLPKGRGAGIVADNFKRVDGAVRIRRCPADVAFGVVRRVAVETLRFKSRTRRVTKVMVVVMVMVMVVVVVVVVIATGVGGCAAGCRIARLKGADWLAGHTIEFFKM